jgi:hypothetical protein
MKMKKKKIENEIFKKYKLCNHSLGEMETACAEGLCPLCMQKRIKQLGNLWYQRGLIKGKEISKELLKEFLDEFIDRQKKNNFKNNP